MMSSMRRVTATVAVVAVAALGACSGDGKDQKDAKPSPDAETTSSAHVEISDAQGSLEDFVGAKDDAEVGTCEVSDGELKVAGTVKNPEPDAQRYRIYVSALAKGDTLGLTQVDLDSVDSGATEKWSASMPVDADEIECILRVERAAP